MKTITTTEARKNIADLVNHVRETGEAFAIGRRNRPEVLVIKFPDAYNPAFNDITNVNATSASFDFWKDEPDIYTLEDAKEIYV
jgi:antitoxin (DNA-binding transcriptional repressor) of toxin-antitoxin stability system